MNYQEIFQRVIADPRYLANLDWGTPRSGHPEGTVRAHIAEIEPNLDRLRSKLSDVEYWKLKVLIHTHDSFKAEAKSGVPILDPASHASLAKSFLESFCDDADLLNMVQYHDEPFALYRQVQAKGSYQTERMNRLLTIIQDWDLFLAFQLIDGYTRGKSIDPLNWLFQELTSRVNSRFSVADILV